jgi:hypothetical protein
MRTTPSSCPSNVSFEPLGQARWLRSWPRPPRPPGGSGSPRRCGCLRRPADFELVAHEVADLQQLAGVHLGIRASAALELSRLREERRLVRVRRAGGGCANRAFGAEEGSDGQDEGSLQRQARQEEGKKRNVAVGEPVHS